MRFPIGRERLRSKCLERSLKRESTPKAKAEERRRRLAQTEPIANQSVWGTIVALRIFIASITVLIVGSLLDHARADVGYVCDGNVVVMVAPRDLERMKRENACVASHYGLQVATPAGTSPAAKAAPETDLTARPLERTHSVPFNGQPVLRGALLLEQESPNPQGAVAVPSEVPLWGGVRLINSAPTASD